VLARIALGRHRCCRSDRRVTPPEAAAYHSLVSVRRVWTRRPPRRRQGSDPPARLALRHTPFTASSTWPRPGT